MADEPVSVTQRIRIADTPDRAPWLDVAFLLVVITVLGAVAGGLLAWSGPRYAAQATVLVTGVGEPGESLYAVDQYVLDRAATWAAVAESTDVSDAAAARLGEPAGALREAITAVAPTAQTRVQLTVEAPDPDQAVRRAAVVASTTAETVNAQELVPGMRYPRVNAAVIAIDDTAVDARWLDVRFAAVPAAIVALLIGWTVLAIRRPGSWARRLSPPLEPERQQDELPRIDQSVQLEVLGALLLGQSARGVAIAGLGLFGVFGYALTGSPLPPLIVVVLAGIAARKDLRIAAGAILYAGATVFPAKVELVDLGLLTPTVLEVAVAIGVVLTALQWHRDRGPRGVFDGPVLAILAAVVVGAVVSIGNGTGQSDVVDPARALLTLVSFFVIRRAFRGRPYQLFAILLIMAAVSAVVALIGVGLGLELLAAGSAEYVVTGSETADVSRVNTPALELWSPLLVVLAAGVVRLRPRWLWAVVLIPCLALQALSFDRTTWATLLVLAVVVAVLRGGRTGLVMRATALVLAGAIGLTALSAGAFGPEGEAVALRLTSVLTGEALAENSLSDRLEENEAARATLRESPFFGTGLGAYYGAELVTYDNNLDVLTPDPRPWIHNQYYRIWLWMGVLGLLAYGSVGVRLVAFAWHSRVRRGKAATMEVAAAAGLASIAGQAIFATNLDFPATVISVGVVLALMELSGTTAEDRPRVGGAPSRFPDRVVPRHPSMRP
jgi:O-antigen ligase/capsular polysaccharide biosynthesis protein